MVSKTVTVVNSQGFHMRPAAAFSAVRGKFKSQNRLESGGQSGDGKSLMNIIAACIKCGAEVKVTASGEDEDAALEKAVSMIEAGLGET